MLTESLNSDYEVLNKSAGIVRLKFPTFVEMKGESRRKFLHNFCTANIDALDDGKTSEAFVLNEKGKILGFVNVLALEDSLVLVSSSSQFSQLSRHLDRYNFRDEIILVDLSLERECFFLSGPQAAATVKRLLGIELGENETCVCTVGSQQAVVANIELAGFGYFIGADSSARLETVFSENGVAVCSPEALSIVRVEKRTPLFGVDASEDNLPQELQRDDLAVSFEKGCYLGQETVARIDAMGRVNQLLVSLTLSAKCQPGTRLSVDGKTAGRVTSIVWSPEALSWIGLGYVRRSFLESDLGFECQTGTGIAKKLSETP